MLTTLANVRSHRRLSNYIALGFLLRHELGKNVFSLARSVSTTCVLCAKVRQKAMKAELSEKKLVRNVSVSIPLSSYSCTSVLVLNTVTVFVK